MRIAETQISIEIEAEPLWNCGASLIQSIAANLDSFGFELLKCESSDGVGGLGDIALSRKGLSHPVSDLKTWDVPIDAVKAAASD
jgi:hypothetical protein